MGGNYSDVIHEDISGKMDEMLFLAESKKINEVISWNKQENLPFLSNFFLIKINKNMELIVSFGSHNKCSWMVSDKTLN